MSMHAMAQPLAPPPRAEASITGLGYRLIDLAPDDGQDPWLDLRGRWGSVSASIRQPSGGELRDYLDQHGQLNLTDGANSVFGEVSAEGARLTLTLGDMNTYIAGTSDYRFEVSPYTQVIFTADAYVATYGGPDDFPTFASASLTGISDDGAGMPGTTSIGASEGTASQSATLDLLYSSGAANSGGFLSLGGSLWGSVSPVPEPSRVWILLLGLPVVFAATRRRHRPRCRTASGHAFIPGWGRANAQQQH